MTVLPDGSIPIYEEVNVEGRKSITEVARQMAHRLRSSEIDPRTSDDIRIGLDHGEFTIAPTSLVEVGEAPKYLLSTPVSLDEIAVSVQQEETCIFRYGLKTRRLLNESLPGATVHHLADPIIRFLKRDSDYRPTVYFLEKDGVAYVLAYNDQKLIMVKRVSIFDWKDALYFLWLAADRLSARAEEIIFKISTSPLLAKKIDEELAARNSSISLLNWLNGWRLPNSVKDSWKLFDLYCIHHADHSRRI